MTIGSDLARTESDVQGGLSDTREGQVDSVDWEARLVVINLGSGLQTMPFAGDPVWPGDKVRIVYVGQKPVCIGLAPRHPLGTVVTAPASGKMVVLGDDTITYRYPVNGAVTFAAGQRVFMDHRSRVVVGPISSEPFQELPTTPVGPGGGGVADATFYPTDSANYSGTTYRDPGAEISDSRAAFYWYGAQIRDTVPDGATILEARIYLAQEWDQVPGANSSMGVHGDGHRVGPPALAGALAIGSGTGWRDISTFATALQIGTYVGVGFYAGAGWRRFGAASSSGQIYMKWRV